MHFSYISLKKALAQSNSSGKSARPIKNMNWNAKEEFEGVEIKFSGSVD